MNANQILGIVLETRAKEIAKELLIEVAKDYSFGLKKETRIPFKNKRLRNKWYRSIAASLYLKAKNL